ncbi:hypothetical protein V8E52_004104 [Russula decolorans]
MFPTCFPFPSSGDDENVPVSRSEKRTRRNALVDGQSASHPTATLRARLMTRPHTTGMKSSSRPLLHAISRGQSITILTNPARAQARSVLPTIHEEVTPSPLSTIYRPSSPSPVSSRASVRQSRSPPQITILSDLEREKREAHPRSIPNPKSILLNATGTRPFPSVESIQWSSPSPLHITILSDPEKEKREAHPQRPKSILINPERTVNQSRSPSHITVLSNPEKEKHEAHPRSTQRIKSIQNALAAALAPKRLPTISITPISILKAPTSPPQAPAPAPAADPKPDVVKENRKVMFVVSEILAQETGQSICDPETGTGADTAMMSSREMLGVPLVDWRGRLDGDELARYYPKEHAKEQFVRRLHSMVRSGNRSAAARRRDYARRRRQTATATTTSPSISLIVSHTRA